MADAVPNELTGQTFSITVNPVDDATPTITTNNGLTLDEGATATIPLASLEADDADTDNLTLTYTITASPSNGQVENTDNPGISISSFTQQNLIDGKIRYVHDGSNTTSDSFTFKVADAVPNELTGQTFSITVNPVAGFTITESDGTTHVLESGTDDSFTIQLDAMPVSNVVIDLENGNTSEISISPSNLTFTSANWNVPQTINITTVDDDYDDGDQSVEITISVNDEASDDDFDAVDNQVVTVLSVDDESVGFTLSKLTVSVSEEGTTDNISISLDARPVSNVVLNISNSNETEATVLPTTLTFTNENWSAGQMITVTGQNDDVADGDQLSTITVSVDDPGSDDAFDALPDQTVSITITDNEIADFTLIESAGYTLVNESGTSDLFSLRLTGKPLSNVVLSISSNDTGEASVDKATLTFTPDNWNTYQTVTVTGVDDVLTDGEQIATITIAVVDGSSDDAFDSANDKEVSVIIADNESPGFTISQTHGSTYVTEGMVIDTLWVVLNSVPLSTVILSFESDDTGEVITESPEYTFTIANWNIPRGFLIRGVNDNLVDGDISTHLTIGVIDMYSDDSYDSLADQIINVINTDNDVAAYTLSKNTASVHELETGDSFTVVLNAQPVSDVVFTINNSDDGEVLVDLSSVTFTTSNWNSAQTVSLSGVADSRIDGNQLSTITVSIDPDNSNDFFDALADQTVTVTIIDDNVAALAIVESGGNSGVDESGASDSFTVALRAQPDFDVVINIANADAGELSVTPASLTFTSANWNAPQTVSLTGEDDLFDDGDQSTLVTLSVDAPGSDDLFDAMPIVTVEVITTDDDASPVVTASQSLSIDEDAENTDSVGTVLATDADAGTTLSNWTITNGNTDAIFVINASSGEITIADNTNLDFETTESYTLAITVSDGTNTSAVENVIITINNINDNTPVVTVSQSFSIDEDAENTASVGTVLATDADAGTTLSNWTITSGNDDAVFEINAGTGEITIADNSNLDFETTQNYTLAITVSDGINTSGAENVTVTINNINDNTPVVTASQSFSVDEDAENTASVGTVLATDADAGTTLSNWTITSGNTDAIFVINASSGDITVDNNTNLDFETTESYTLAITVSDGTNTSVVENVILTINNINDNTPVVTASQTFSVDEDAENTDSVGTVLATDADAGTTLSNWTITNGNTDAIFVINASSGEITVDNNTDLNFETTQSYTLEISVSDGTNTSAVESVIIDINDTNDNAPIVTASQSFSVDEDAVNTTSAGTVLATDADAGTIFSSWSIASGNVDAIFGIDASGQISIADNSNLDFETTQTYTLEISVSDGTNTSSVETVSIDVNDINEAPTAIQLSNIIIAENAVVGTEVGTLTASDVDANQTFTYTIADNENFEIVGDKLLSKAVFNFVNQNSYSVEITVRDQGGLNHKQSISIQISNVNKSPTAIQLSNTSIAENSEIGTEVGILTATDPDINQTFTFSLSENKYFEVDGDRIVSKEIFDFEDHISYSVKVIVTDQGGLSYDDRFTLHTEDVNEAPEFTSEPVLEARVGERFAYILEYHDVDANGCTVAAFEIPSWLILEDNEDEVATLSGIPTEAGTFNVILEVSDNEYTARQEFEIIVEIVTGIEDIVRVPIVSIYPNPVVRELHIDLTDFRNDEITISLFSMTGSLIFKEEHKNVGGEVRIIKSVQQLRSGVYLLVIESEEYRKSYKIVKQ